MVVAVVGAGLGEVLAGTCGGRCGYMGDGDGDGCDA